MDSCIAITGKGYIIMAADTSHAHSIITQKEDMDKILELDSGKLINCVELDPGDRANFLEFVQKNLHLHEFRTGKKLATAPSASWIRRQLADYLRSRTPFRVNLLLGGVEDNGERVQLYYLDYLASCVQVPFAAQGYAGYMAPAVLDKWWKPDMTLQEGHEVMKKVVDQLRTRLVFSQKKFIVKTITKDGIEVSYL